jgi:ERCC4-type nuclease
MLIIDSRENSNLSKLIIKRANKKSIPTEKKWLEIGDYVIGDVCIEAKSAMDFMGSVINKRIWTQLDNMDRCFKKNFVVVYGTVNEALGVSKYMKNVSKESLRLQFIGAIGRMRLDYDVGVIWRNSITDAVDEIITIARMAPIDRKVINPALLKRIATNDIRVDLLCAIKGISQKKANLLLKEFGSIMEIGDCSVEELSTIEGIGKTISERILSTLNSEDRVKQ